jgi:hypothetical protein
MSISRSRAAIYATALSAASLTSASLRGQQPTQTISLAAGVPLHVRITRTAHLHTGTPVTGVLTEPIFVHDRLILPIGTRLQGTVTAYTPIDRIVREQALLNGDITPLHDPVVDFTSAHLDATPSSPAQDIPLDTRALIRSAKLVRFTNARKPSLPRQAVIAVKTSVHNTYESIVGPGKKDRALRLLYSQLPYHPQRIWAGTQFIADLNSEAPVDLAAQPLAPVSQNPTLNGITVNARIVSALDSASSRKGDLVTAILTAPVFDSDHQLILPEGAQLDGLVSAAKPARSFGRNGQLRFAIRGIKDTAPTTQTGLNAPASKPIYGTLTGAEGSANENLSVDAEGNVNANPDKGRFVAPLLLAVTALAGGREHHHDNDGGGVGGPTVASNGFGLIARVIAIVDNDRAVALGFGGYAFAKSIYFRFLIRGHEVTFPKDTQVEVTLATR